MMPRHKGAVTLRRVTIKRLSLWLNLVSFVRKRSALGH
jgi:hypothetical protein